jgi:hypothetical protein
VVIRDPTHQKGRLELWVPVYRFLHREVVELVSENDAATCVERARCQVVDEQLVGCINISHSVVRPPRDDTPVVRVVFPYDSYQAHCICNCANTVL